MDRHARQIKLVEVGGAGQARIGAARVDVPDSGLAGEVAARYLAGAGVGRIRVRAERIAAIARAIDPAISVEVIHAGEADLRGLGEASDLHDSAAQAVERGARFALAALRDALGGAP